jgi:hypothetical protein
MKYAALAVIFCIGLIAWYKQQDRPPPIDKPAPVQQSPDLPPSGPQRLAASTIACGAFAGTAEWRQLKAIFVGMSDAALCSYIRAPDMARLAGVNADPQAVENLLNGLLDQHDDENSDRATVPDLRYYLDPQAIDVLRGLSATQLIDRINNERSPEAAYLLAQQYQADEQTYVMLMLIAASYAQKPGPLLSAINGCCGWATDDAAGERAAAIRREALIMIAREMNLPETRDWYESDLDPDIEAEVLAQRAAYVQELNQHSIDAFGEEWIK